MKIKKDDAVKCLVALGFADAGDWDDAKLKDRIGKMPSKIDEDEVPEGFQGLYDEIANSDADEVIELVGGKKAKKKAASKKKPAAKKPAKEKPAKEKAKPAAKKKAAPEKAAPEKAKPAAKKPAKKVEETAVERDSFGSKEGSISAKVNAEMSTDWQSETDVAKAAGVTLDQARGRFYFAATGETPIFEVRRLVQYRIVKKAKK